MKNFRVGKSMGTGGLPDEHPRDAPSRPDVGPSYGTEYGNGAPCSGCGHLSLVLWHVWNGREIMPAKCRECLEALN